MAEAIKDQPVAGWVRGGSGRHRMQLLTLVNVDYSFPHVCYRQFDQILTPQVETNTAHKTYASDYHCCIGSKGICT